MKHKKKVVPNKNAPPGQGGRFAYLTKKKHLSPALAAYIGRKKYGKAGFQKLGR